MAAPLARSRNAYGGGIRLLSLFLFSLATLDAFAQPQESPTRLHVEKDWVFWKKAIVKPDTVHKLVIREMDRLDTAMLKRFTSLTGLIIEDTDLSDLNFLSQFTHLTVLEISGNSLHSLNGIQRCPSLREVGVNNNFISDLTPLRDMKELTYLMLYNNDITDLQPIAGLLKLELLELGRNPLTRIDMLKGMTRLRSFSVYKCEKLKNVEVIRNFRALTDLNVSLLTIPDFSLSFLKGLDKIDNLRIQGVVRNNDELKHIMHLKDMVRLTMGMNDSVTCIDSLYRMTQLDYLDIHSNNIRSIAVIRNLPRLSKLVMYKNQVTDISPILDLQGLRALYLNGNPVADYGPLYQKKRLQYLCVSRRDFDDTKLRQLKRALPRTEITWY